MNNPFDQAKQDSERCIKHAPGYFLAWYTFKSLALVGAVATAAYQLGRKRAEREAAKAKSKTSAPIITTKGNVVPIGGGRG